MPEYCPKCNKEVLPYLNTGEFKKVVSDELVKYQLYWCISCRVVYYDELERYDFLNFKLFKIRKEILNGLASKAREISS